MVGILCIFPISYWLFTVCLSVPVQHDFMARLIIEMTCSGVARICCEEGHRWKLCHGSLTVDVRTGCTSCSMTDSFVTNASKEL